MNKIKNKIISILDKIAPIVNLKSPKGKEIIGAFPFITKTATIFSNKDTSGNYSLPINLPNNNGKIWISVYLGELYQAVRSKLMFHYLTSFKNPELDVKNIEEDIKYKGQKYNNKYIGSIALIGEHNYIHFYTFTYVVQLTFENKKYISHGIKYMKGMSSPLFQMLNPKDNGIVTNCLKCMVHNGRTDRSTFFMSPTLFNKLPKVRRYELKEAIQQVKNQMIAFKLATYTEGQKGYVNCENVIKSMADRLKADDTKEAIFTNRIIYNVDNGIGKTITSKDGVHVIKVDDDNHLLPYANPNGNGKLYRYEDMKPYLDEYKRVYGMSAIDGISLQRMSMFCNSIFRGKDVIINDLTTDYDKLTDNEKSKLSRIYKLNFSTHIIDNEDTALDTIYINRKFEGKLFADGKEVKNGFKIEFFGNKGNMKFVDDETLNGMEIGYQSKQTSRGIARVWERDTFVVDNRKVFFTNFNITKTLSISDNFTGSTQGMFACFNLSHDDGISPIVKSFVKFPKSVNLEMEKAYKDYQGISLDKVNEFVCPIEFKGSVFVDMSTKDKYLNLNSQELFDKDRKIWEYKVKSYLLKNTEYNQPMYETLDGFTFKHRQINRLSIFNTIIQSMIVKNGKGEDCLSRYILPFIYDTDKIDCESAINGKIIHNVEELIGNEYYDKFTKRDDRLNQLKAYLGYGNKAIYANLLRKINGKEEIIINNKKYLNTKQVLRNIISSIKEEEKQTEEKLLDYSLITSRLKSFLVKPVNEKFNFKTYSGFIMANNGRIHILSAGLNPLLTEIDEEKQDQDNPLNPDNFIIPMIATPFFSCKDTKAIEKLIISNYKTMFERKVLDIVSPSVSNSKSITLFPDESLGINEVGISKAMMAKLKMREGSRAIVMKPPCANYHSTLYMFVVERNPNNIVDPETEDEELNLDNDLISVSPKVIKLLGADNDGDTLSITSENSIIGYKGDKVRKYSLNNGDIVEDIEYTVNQALLKHDPEYNKELYNLCNVQDEIVYEGTKEMEAVITLNNKIKTNRENTIINFIKPEIMMSSMGMLKTFVNNISFHSQNTIISKFQNNLLEKGVMGMKKSDEVINIVLGILDTLTDNNLKDLMGLRVKLMCQHISLIFEKLGIDYDDKTKELVEWLIMEHFVDNVRGYLSVNKETYMYNFHLHKQAIKRNLSSFKHEVLEVKLGLMIYHFNQ